MLPQQKTILKAMTSYKLKTHEHVFVFLVVKSYNDLKIYRYVLIVLKMNYE